MYAHIFIDAENIDPRLFFQTYEKLKTKYMIKKVECFGHIDKITNSYKEWEKYHYNFTIIDCNVAGKGNADVVMAMNMTQAIFEEPMTEVFIVITQDKDFFPVIDNMLSHGKRVIYVAKKEPFPYLRPRHNLEKLIISIPKKEALTFHKLAEHKKQPIKGMILNTIYMKNNKKEMYEVPFYNGMNLQKFLSIIPLKNIKRGYIKSTKLKNILYDNYLYIDGANVYVDIDRIMKVYRATCTCMEKMKSM